MLCVPPSKRASSHPQSQGNLEFRNPMSGRRWRRGGVEKPDLVSKDRTAPTGHQPIRLVDRPRAPNLRFLNPENLQRQSP
jgi:hypothetical protein